MQAPAGSGKTELLIRRFLALLATVDEPEEIVAVTFTRKAAGEMRARVLQAIADGAVADRWDLAAHPARLRIQTIDALCASLTRQMPLLSRFGAAPAIAEDPAALYIDAARATLARAGAEAIAEGGLERLLLHLDNDAARIAGLIAGMLARRDQWIRHLSRIDRARLEGALRSARAEAVSRVTEAVPGVVRAELYALTDYAFGNLGRSPFERSRAEDWHALAEILLTDGDRWRARLTKNEGFPAGKAAADWKARAAELVSGLPEDFRAVLAGMKHLPPERYTDVQWAVLEAIAELLPQALAQLNVVFQLRGEVDFTEVALAALAALGDESAPTDLALALDTRIRHLLVDEFQDTSISQYELIARLTAGWETGDGRTIFVVGDPMQSIYRFREAEVGEFLKTWASQRLGAVKVELVRLAANFRSQEGIVGWVNAAFAHVLPVCEEPAEGAVPYAASQAVCPALGGAAVRVHAFFDDDREAEAACVAELVTAAQAEDPGSTVAILVRNRAHLGAIVPRLKAGGLRFRAIEIDPLGERPVVSDLLALTRAITHPADRVAWLSVLRAPWCGLLLADLCALAEGREGAIWDLMQDDARLSEDGRRRLARVREVLGAVLARRLRTSLRDAVEGAWLALGGPACAADETGIEDAEVFLDALSAAEVAGEIPDMSDFEESVAELWALPDVHAVEADVQIMTIHKAKGLEFDHVIVPGLGRSPRVDDKRLFLWMERQSARGPELLVAPIEEAGAENDAIYAWLRRLDARRADHEAGRLLYVAATRARRRLHLLGDVKREEDGTLKEPAPGSLLAKLWTMVQPAFADAAARYAGRAVRAEESEMPNQALIRQAPGWRLPDPPAAVHWEAAEETARTESTIEFSWAGETARHVGTVVHRWLQRMAEDALSGWTAARVAGLHPKVLAELEALGVPDAERETAAGRVRAALAATIADTRGRWLLGPQREARNEYRLRAVTPSGLRTFVIDRVFVDERGERWIVDWKTSRHEGTDVEGFLDRERERYRTQMENYRAALGGGRCGLYFPLHGAWREL